MKSIRKIAALLLAMLFILSAFVACDTPSVTPPDDGSTEITEAPGVDYQITEKNLAEYTIVRADKASNEIKTAAYNFRLELKAAFGSEVGIQSDWIKNVEDLPTNAKEIVIGSTNRPDGVEIEHELRENDYAVICKNDRIFIIGGSDSSTLKALEYFKATYLNTEKKTISLNTKLVYKSLYEYPISRIEINGVNLRDYTVVIPDKADLSTAYAALNLSDFLLANAGFEMTISTDKEAEVEYEILIGATNREESTVSVAPSLANGEYVFYKTESKIVCTGESYMVGGGVGDLVSRIPVDGKNVEVSIDDIPTEAAVKTFTFKEAKSAILMIGDGMGFNTVEMSLPTINHFIANDLPNKGNAYTGSLTTQSNPAKPTDSAASGTALSTATKTINGYIGVDKNKNTLQNIRELAAAFGARTGVISTDVITGATPSAFLAHHKSRNDTSILQGQIDKLISDGKVDWCSGDIGDKLTSDTAAALRKLSAGGSPFFLMVEEGHIDKRSHKNDASGCIKMVKRFNDDIAYVIQFVLCHPDTALVITADHETGGITKQSDGSFKYTLDDHSTANVPTYAIGYGTEYFSGKEVDNTEIPKFLAKIFGNQNFGKK